MNRKPLHHRWHVALIVLACIVMLPVQAWAAGQQGIYLEGTRSVDKHNIIINEDFTITYCINPAGTYVQRDPINVALVMDVSGSMDYQVSRDNRQTRMSIAKQSAKLITGKFRKASYNDRVGLVTFESHPHHLQGLTTNYNQIDSLIDTRLRPGGGTNIQMGLNYGYQVVQHSSPATSSIILLTDGAASAYYYKDRRGNLVLGTDSYGATAKQYAKDEADIIARTGVPVYTIALATSGTNEVDLDLLSYISQKTGGRSFTATNEEELDKAFESILELIEPSYQDVVLNQPFPPGFELAPDETGASMANGVLTMKLGNIPYQADDYRCQYPVKLRYTGAPDMITLAPATIDYKVDGQARQAIIDDKIVLTFYDALGLQGVARAKDALTPEQLAEWNLDQPFPVTYTLSKTGTLVSGRNDKVRDVKLVHKLPDGVIAIADNSNPGLVISDEGRTVAFHLGEQKLSDTYALTKNVQLKFSHAGSFDLKADSAELYVEYTNNIGQAVRVPLANELPALDVFAILIDKWNNKYIGDGDGLVTRKDSSGQPQWYVDLSEQPIRGLAFDQPSEQTVVSVSFSGGAADQLLNLLPTVPDVTIRDFHGTAIAEGDTAYKRGYGKLSAVGAKPGLPSGTQYVGDSFQADYVAYYQYRVDGGDWTNFSPSDEKTLGNVNGENLAIEIRAVTEAISDGTVQHAGMTKSRIVSLDGVPPTIPLIDDSHAKLEGDNIIYTIPDAFSDAHSGIRTDADGDKVYMVIVDGEAPVQQKINTAGLTVKIPRHKVQSGLAKIVVADRVGNSNDATLPIPTETDAPTFEFILTSKQVYKHDGANNTYKARTSGNESFDYSQDKNARLTITARDATSDLQSFEYRLDGGAWQSVGVSGKSASVEIDLSDKYGWHTAEARAADIYGNPGSAEYVFMVNPGLSGTVSMQDMDGATYTSSKTANKPVKVTLQTTAPVQARFDRQAVELREVYYMITDSAAKPDLASSDWKSMAADSLMVAREGESYVHFKLIDQMGITTIESSASIHINFNQNRY